MLRNSSSKNKREYASLKLLNKIIKKKNKK